MHGMEKRPRFPGIFRQTVASAVESAQRFPLVVGASILGVVLVLGADRFEDCWWQLQVLALSLPCFTTIRIVADRQQWREFPALWGARALVLSALFGYYLMFPEPRFTYQFVQYWILFTVALLALSLSTLSSSAKTLPFWQANRLWMGRFLSMGLLCTMLFWGAAIAIGLVVHLFHVRETDRTLVNLWVVVMGFHPWLVVAGLPKQWHKVDEDEEYPRYLKVLSYTTLAPLTVLYLAIFYVHFASVVLQGELPDSSLAWPVVGASLIGYSAWLLMDHTRASRQRAAFPDRFLRVLSTAILPLILVAAYGLLQRIREYGVTEPRYLVGLFLVWLGGLSIFYLARPSAGPKWIPLTLAACLLVTNVGPWGRLAVSQNSQEARFRAKLTKHKLVSNGLIQEGTTGLAAAGPEYLYIRKNFGFANCCADLVDAHGATEAEVLARFDRIFQDHGYNYRRHRYIYFDMPETLDVSQYDLYIDGSKYDIKFADRSKIRLELAGC